MQHATSDEALPDGGDWAFVDSASDAQEHGYPTDAKVQDLMADVGAPIP